MIGFNGVIASWADVLALPPSFTSLKVDLTSYRLGQTKLDSIIFEEKEFTKCIRIHELLRDVVYTVTAASNGGRKYVIDIEFGVLETEKQGKDDICIEIMELTVSYIHMYC